MEYGYTTPKKKKPFAETLGMVFAIIFVIIPISAMVCSAALWVTVWLLTHLSI